VTSHRKAGGEAKTADQAKSRAEMATVLCAKLLLLAVNGVFHRITLSARASTFCGIVRPICYAVLRLISSSNFVGCSTGRSAGLAPLRILSTYVATRR